MNPQPSLAFPPFCFDPINECLWRGEQQLPLRGKTFAVLRYLLEHPHQLVTKETLFNAVWPNTTVEEGALTICIHELRHALGDDAKTPQFIETVHRRGYRFIAPLSTAPPVASKQHSVASRQKAKATDSQLATDNWQLATHLVGREAELTQLHNWLEKVSNGERQIVFVTGEPGIGKTSVVEAFLQQVAAEGSMWIGRGQCVEHYGAGEGYMPMLEALGRLCREPGGEHLIELLGQHAPTWLVQMPALLSAADLEVLQRKVQGATRERMLREMAEAVEALTAERPLVLRLEDLHWSDVSTLELLSVLARRQEAARLLVLGTYRPVEMLGDGHPLRAVTQELQLHRQCEELPLTLLSEAAIAEYLAMRLCTVPSPLAGEGQDRGSLRQQLSRRPPHPSPLPQGEREAAPLAAALQRLARAIHQRTDGNPLFMVNVVDYLLTQGGTTLEDLSIEVPTSIRQMIERQIERLSLEEQRMLEVASVAGAEFSAAAVAAGAEVEVSEVEARCAGLARREQFLRASGVSEWPDGTVAARYGFLHALYQEVLYERVPAGRRIELHRQIGEREEQGYSDRAREVAAELAVHFERGRDYRKAVQYLQQAGENALRRSAYQEAINLLTRGLELLKTLPETLPATPERAQQELTLQIALGDALVAVKGYTVLEVEKTVLRTRELCQQLGETPQLFPVLFRLGLFYSNRGELQTARELAEQLMRLAQSVQDPYLLSLAHTTLGWTLFWLGELTSARPHLEQAIALYDPQKHPRPTVNTADPRVDCLSHATWTLWDLGYPDQALKTSYEVVALAEGLSHPFSLACALGFTAPFHLLRGEGPLAQEQAEAVITLSTEQGFPSWLALGTMVRGSVLAEQGQVEEGIAQMQQGLTALRALGAETARITNLPRLAAAYGRVGRVKEGLAVLAEALALVDKTGSRVSEAELYRLKGELTLQKFKVQGSKFKVEESSESGVRSPKSKVKTSLGQVKTSQGKSEVPNTQHPIPNTQVEVEREAEECFLKAIEIARRQSAKSLELRATVSLVRLRQQQAAQYATCNTQHDGRPMLDAARNMLSEIYGWFTEGFDTKDLQEAKTLLEELKR